MYAIKQFIVGLLQSNCYLLISEGELVIIDPGGESERILREIKKTEATVKYIINTHHHSDHISANEVIRMETGAEILIHEKEKSFIDFEADKFLREGDDIEIRDSVLGVIHTPGHTPGSICLLGDNFIFTGDTIFQHGYGRTDLLGGSLRGMEKSLKRLSGLIHSGTIIYPGHGEFFKAK